VFQEMVAAGPAKGVVADLDGIRRQKIAAVEAITGRPLVIYVVDIQNPQKTGNNGLLSLLNFSDKDGFTEATRKIDGENLDVLIQSLGGLAEAVESIVAMLRARFKHIRFIVPSIAKSAATMLALSGDEVVGGETAELGPIDPQMPTGRGGFAPAQAILDQFESATKALKGDPGAMSAWLPILQQYGPSMLVECKNRQALSEKLVSTWLKEYMFHGEPNAGRHAAKVARRLNAHNAWLAHGRRIGLKWLHDELGVKVHDLDADVALHEAVWGLHLAISITFTSSGAFKIVENSQGDALVGLAQLLNVQLMAQPMPQPPPQPPPASPAPHN
jgi:hypothetical protein